MTKAVFKYDLKTKEFAGSLVVDDDYEVADGQTEIAPEKGLYQPATFDGTKWVGADKEVYDAELEKLHQSYLKEHPELAPKPSSEQLMINALGQQVASLTVRLAQANATSTAPASDATTTNNGGAA